ncbi:TPA: hypothetical protein MYH88_001008 [Klebsiella pneumoniae]|uniref:hypothetical protein n=1 Tax=Klebsiella pneumoniae TaxID=573 RepID=UPI0024DE51D3|nr:hypothetical protein [Klebsiella pneumoniae]MDK1765302.1 hypothetical protein [Klebsiella pneumoniae]MEE4426471.1 hypothetical protein [Klebsiella pneumoniae]HCA8418753.1 hypothetical protein [Klebsiella pneumoniae]HCA8423235.1 hypothetical protein [Klebsiella pneumoniae]HCA8434905.1 hypothetical protein [Klebsiella pneumoniae]
MINNQLTTEELKEIRAISAEGHWPIVWTKKKALAYFREKITPLVVMQIADELQARRKADSEPVAIVEPSDYVTAAQLVGEESLRKAVRELYEGALRIGDKLYRHAQPSPEMKPVGYLFVSEQGAIAYSPTNWGMPGFRLIGQIYGDIDVESQPAPVVPDDVLDALQKVARIRLDLNDFDGDRRGIADCLCDAEEALIEVVNRCAAMLAPAPQEDINALITLVSRNEQEVK